jgi:hypothetical protein
MEWFEKCRQLWKEQNDAGLQWKITDFVTVGSPLTYADLLLADSRSDFHVRVARRELPTAPPVLRNESFAVIITEETVRMDRSHALNPFAVFAITVWTNIYFPSSWLLKGDFLGGPLMPLFKEGILDKPISGGWFAHTRYWKRGKGQSDTPSLRALRDALDLQKASFSKAE